MHLLLRGFEFLGRRLQLLDHRGELLVGRFELLVGRFEVLGDDIVLLASLAQIDFELLHAGVVGRRLPMLLLRFLGLELHPADVVEDDRIEFFAAGADVQRLDDEVDRLAAAVGIDADVGLDGAEAGLRGLVQGDTQLQPKPPPRHQQQIGIRCAGRRLEILAGPRGEIQHLAVGIDDDVGRRVTEDRALRQLEGSFPRLFFKRRF